MVKDTGNTRHNAQCGGQLGVIEMDGIVSNLIPKPQRTTLTTTFSCHGVAYLLLLGADHQTKKLAGVVDGSTPVVRVLICILGFVCHEIRVVYWLVIEHQTLDGYHHDRIGIGSVEWIPGNCFTVGIVEPWGPHSSPALQVRVSLDSERVWTGELEPTGCEILSADIGC